MDKQFEMPKIEVIELENTDIITESCTFFS